MTRLWDKGTPLDDRVLNYTAGEDYGLDERLVRYDVRAAQPSLSYDPTQFGKYLSTLTTPRFMQFALRFVF